MLKVMKKILAALTVFMMISGTAYAAVSINGLYKGRSIVKVLVNGVEVKSTVPAQNIDGSTMLPLRVIGESLGAKVEWNQSKYQASVTMPQQAQEGLTLEQLNKIGESVGLIQALDASGKPMRYGTGFVVNGNILVSNHHVIQGSTSLKVTFGTKETTVPSTLLFDNAEKDLAGVRLDGFPSLTLETDEPKLQDLVWAMGFPDKRFTLTEGKILSQYTTGEIFHNAHTDSGSSGGPIIGDDGEVIGVSVGVVDGTQYNAAMEVDVLQGELDKLK